MSTGLEVQACPGAYGWSYMGQFFSLLMCVVMFVIMSVRIGTDTYISIYIYGTQKTYLHFLWFRLAQFPYSRFRVKGLF